MTPLPPRRRQHPLHLDGAWLLTASPDGDRQVPGMSVVADPKGFTLTGPDPSNERTIPWEQTTGFTCQRPARLLDGSPATVLEVGLANGRVLELLLPVTRVPPSETVVVETELAVMAEQYGGQKTGSEQPQSRAQPQPQAQQPQAQPPQPTPPAPPLAQQPQAQPPLAQPPQAAAAQEAPAPSGSNGQAPGARTQPPRPNGPEPLQRTREQAPALALQGAHTNGSSTKASSTLSADAPAPGAPAAAAATLSRPARVADRVIADEAADTVTAPPVEKTAAPAEPVATPAETTRRKAKDEDEVAARSEQDEASQSSSVERRENRMFTLLVALIGIVVVVLIAELVLILFVLNHNPSTKGKSIGLQTNTLVYYPSSISRL